MPTHITKLDPALVVGRVFVGTSLIFMIIILLLLWQDQKTFRESSRVNGTVSSLDYDGEGLAAPVIGYRHNGQKKFLRGTVRSSPPSFEVGEQVELLVNNNDAEKVIINSFFERYFLIFLLTFFVLVFGGIGTALLTLMKK